MRASTVIECKTDRVVLAPFFRRPGKRTTANEYENTHFGSHIHTLMVQIDTEYLGDLHCEARHGPSGVTLITDAPQDNHGRGASFSPTDLVATALGTCIATILGIQADEHDLDLEGIEITVEKEMAANPRRIASLRTEVHMPTALDEQMRTRLERAARHCPVDESIHPDIDAPIRFHWPEKTPA
jgi:putative redox protein